MTASEYQQLVEFLSRQFTAIDQRFDSLQQHIDERFREVFGHFDEIYRRLESLSRSIRRSSRGSDGSRPCWSMKWAVGRSWSGASRS